MNEAQQLLRLLILHGALAGGQIRTLTDAFLDDIDSLATRVEQRGWMPEVEG